MIIFSDLHLNEKTANVVFGEVFPGLREAVLNDKDKVLVCLGDFYHIRYKVDVAIQNRCFDYFEDLNGWNISAFLLPGNHDQINENGENALTPFNTLSNVSVIESLYNSHMGTWIPYRKNKEEILEFLLKEQIESTVFMHQGIIDFEVNNGWLDKDGIPINLLSDFPLVLSGHYHKRQNKGNIFYVGSPYQIDAGESGQDKGYGILKDGKFEYVTTNWGNKYYNLGEVQQGASIDNVKTGDVIRLKAPMGVDLEAYRQSLSIPEGVNCVIEPGVSEAVQRLSVTNNSFDDYVQAYINEFGDNLDKEILFDVYKQLVVK